MDDDQFQPGNLVARRYRLDHRLGSGGMGTVWAATHTVTDKAVALKLLRTRHDATARRRVRREARAACAVHHPSVIVIHDVIEAADGSPVLVMDRLVGESLRARLDRERTLPLAEALGVARTGLEALEVAHAAAIVHRDLKPENLFLLANGELKLLDFGVAKLIASDDAPAGGSGALTTTGAMVGTPFYMAPEPPRRRPRSPGLASAAPWKSRSIACPRRSPSPRPGRPGSLPPSGRGAPRGGWRECFARSRSVPGDRVRLGRRRVPRGLRAAPRPRGWQHGASQLRAALRADVDAAGDPVSAVIGFRCARPASGF